MLVLVNESRFPVRARLCSGLANGIGGRWISARGPGGARPRPLLGTPALPGAGQNVIYFRFRNPTLI